MQNTMLHVDAVKQKVETALSRYFYKHNADKINLKFASPSPHRKNELRCSRAAEEQQMCGGSMRPLSQPVFVHELAASNSGCQ